MNKLMRNLFFLLSIIVFQFAHSQGLTNTPYGQFGIGDIEPVGNTRLNALGSTGYAIPNSGYLNLLNPALSAYNRTNVIFDAGVYMQNIGIKSAGTNGQHITGANIHYFNILMPVTSKFWTATIGLSPYSSANTQYTETNSILNEDGTTSASSVNRKANISGGLTKVFMAHGFKLPKNFAIGINIAYVFGNIRRRYEDRLSFSDKYSILNKREIFKQLEFTFGLSYFKKLKKDYNLYVGAIASVASDAGSVDSVRTSLLNQFDQTYYRNDNVSNNKKVIMPPKIGLGFAIEKADKYNIAFDYTFQKWSSFSSFTNDGFYIDSHRFSVGAEMVPNYNSVKGYLNRVAYRAGFYYYLSPLNINDTRINEFAGSFGMGLPVGKSYLSTLNFTAQIGQRGTLSNNLVQETFIRFFFGININDRWFIKYKLD